MVGDYAYVAAGDDGLRVIDVSVLATPDEVGYYRTGGSCSAVHVAGDYAYLLDTELGFRVMDVSDPADPQDVSSLSSFSAYGDIFVVGNYAYVANGWRGLTIVDISNPVNPLEVTSYDTGDDSARDVYVVGNYAYVAADEAGLLIIDISTPGNPQKVGECDTPWDARGVHVVGNYAYVADDGGDWRLGELGGLRIIDVSDPEDPQQVGFYDAPRYGYAIYVAGNHAYLAADELWIIDVSTPAAPQQASIYYTEDVTDVHVVGSYAYLAEDYFDFSVIDISDPSFPYQVGFYEGGIEAVYAANGYIYTANRMNGMSILRYMGSSGVASIALTDVERDDPDEYWHEFGVIEAGSSKDWDMVIHNVGGGSLTVNSVISDGYYSANFAVISPPIFPQDIASGEELHVTVRFSLDEPGRRYARLIITSSDPDEPVIYVGLEGEAASVDEHEPDNDSANAKQQIPNVEPEPEHSIFPAGDEDWTYFSLATTSYVVAEMHDRGGHAKMWLYNSSLVELDLYDDEDWDNDDEIIQVLPAGVYFLKITGQDVNEICYEYWVELMAISVSPDAHEPDNDSANASIQQPNMASPPSHSIFPAGDEDWFKFTLPATSHVAIDTNDPYDRPLITLYDSSLVEIDSGRHHSFAILDAGTYYIKALANPANDVPVIPEYYVEITSGDPDDTFLIAITEREEDDIEDILDNMGYKYVEIREQELADYDFISFFDVIFINSSRYSADNAPAAADSLERFVDEGGILYVSDWSYIFIETSFPGNITFAPYPYGTEQDLQANVVDAGLADYLGGATLEIEYYEEWMEIHNIGPEVTVHLSGPTNVGPECLDPIIRDNMPQCVSFEYGQGKVVYTTFLNEEQERNQLLPGTMERFIEYLALKPYERMLKELADAMKAQGYALGEEMEQSNINQGATSALFSFNNTVVKDIVFGTNWPGSTLKLSVYRPNGSLYAEQQSDQPPVMIEVGDAEAGEWTYTITGVDVP